MQVIINFVRAIFACDFGRHMTMQWSDWPELFGMARTKEDYNQMPIFRGYWSGNWQHARHRSQASIRFMRLLVSCVIIYFLIEGIRLLNLIHLWDKGVNWHLQLSSLSHYELELILLWPEKVIFHQASPAKTFLSQLEFTNTKPHHCSVHTSMYSLDRSEDGAVVLHDIGWGRGIIIWLAQTHYFGQCASLPPKGHRFTFGITSLPYSW